MYQDVNSSVTILPQKSLIRVCSQTNRLRLETICRCRRPLRITAATAVTTETVAPKSCCFVPRILPVVGSRFYGNYSWCTSRHWMATRPNHNRTCRNFWNTTFTNGNVVSAWLSKPRVLWQLLWILVFNRFQQVWHQVHAISNCSLHVWTCKVHWQQLLTDFSGVLVQKRHSTTTRSANVNKQNAAHNLREYSCKFAQPNEGTQTTALNNWD